MKRINLALLAGLLSSLLFVKARADSGNGASASGMSVTNVGLKFATHPSGASGVFAVSAYASASATSPSGARIVVGPAAIIEVSLSGSTIEPRSFTLLPTEPRSVAIVTARIAPENAAVSPGPAAYTQHEIQIPGYEINENSTSPNRIILTIRAPTLIERFSANGGQSWPAQNNAIFVVETRNASNQLIPFTSPVGMKIQFFDGGPQAPCDDLVDLLGQAAPPSSMGIASDAADGPDVNFTLRLDLDITVAILANGGTVQSNDVQNLTGPSGIGAWGAIARTENAARNWRRFE